MTDFYDRLAPFYHIIYGDWPAAIERQANQLAYIIQTHWGNTVEIILDASCGIGTQAIGLTPSRFSRIN